MKKVLIVLGVLILAGVIIFGLIQLIPYGRNHANPAVVKEPTWDAQTRALARRACMDCHSNETVWPWYSNIAPASWLIQHDVDEGRQRLNFSTWGSGRQEVEEIAGVVLEGEMPPPQYLLIHKEAKLTDAEKQTLVNGLQGLR
jgi:hypothetical protein